MTVRNIVLGAACATASLCYADGARQAASPIIPEGWGAIYEEWGFAPALRSDDMIFVSGIIVRPVGEGDYETRYAAGLRRIFAIVDQMLAIEGASLDDVIEMTSFHTDLRRQLPVILPLRKELMAEPHPAWTAVGTTQLAVEDGLTEIKFTVQLPDRDDAAN